MIASFFIFALLSDVVEMLSMARLVALRFFLPMR